MFAKAFETLDDEKVNTFKFLTCYLLRLKFSWKLPSSDLDKNHENPRIDEQNFAKTRCSTPLLSDTDTSILTCRGHKGGGRAVAGVAVAPPHSQVFDPPLQ
jgi:hypothetical protein